MAEEKQYSVTAVDGYIHLKTWGKLSEHDLEAPAEAAIALGKEKKINRLLDDIRDIDTTDVSLGIQTKAVGILWKLKTFEKVAIIFKTRDIAAMFFNTLEATHLSSKFRGFDNDAEAISWLTEH